MTIYGTTPDGLDFELFTLSRGDLTVQITNYGARLLRVVRDGVDLLYGPKSPEELLADDCYCGAVCGRVANRIAGGSFELDGRRYQLAVNNGPNHLHGGTIGFNARIWSVEQADESRLVLTLLSPDGEEGYPGTVRVRAVYSLGEQGLSLDLEADTDAPTLLNLTNHAYWNLAGQGTIDGHLLSVAADAYTPMVSNIPTGSIEPVEGTLYDLRRPAQLGERNAPSAIAGGYDDNYVLNNGGELREAAVLTCGERRLRVSTNAPGLQVYTGDYLPLKRGGVALEAQNYPDSPHHANFPSIELRPGETYRRRICWQID
ncbi:MAG TPA: galactose mutarotase [Candidatus Akkermansia intestinavium]|nr:galactose mutarotase [Candidatus Akkermansia intestinavium]